MGMGWIYVNLMEAGMWSIDRIPPQFLDDTKLACKRRGLYVKYFGTEEEPTDK